MFNISFPTLILLALSGLITFSGVRLQTSFAERLRPHLLLIWGFALTLGGLFFQPWLRFDPLVYALPEWSPIEGRDTLELAHTLIQSFGLEKFASAVKFLLQITNLNVLSLELVPTLGFWVRIWSLLPIGLNALTFFAICTGFVLQNQSSRRIMFGTLGALLLLSDLALLSSLPAMDALARPGDLMMGVLYVVLGARLGNGTWITLLGLSLSAVGCLAAIAPSPANEGWNSYQETSFDVAI